MLHGTIDSVVVPVNADDTLEQMAQMDDYADDGADNDSVLAQPTSTETRQVEGGHTYTVENFEFGGELLLQRYLIDGLWHMWSGGSGIPPLSDPQSPNASQIFWDFFQSHPM